MDRLVYGLKARLREPKASASYAEPGEDEFVDEKLESKRRGKDKVIKPKSRSAEDRDRKRVERLEAADDWSPVNLKRNDKLRAKQLKKKFDERTIRKRVRKHVADNSVSVDDGVRLSPTRMFALPAELVLMIFQYLELLDVVNIKRALEPYNETSASPIQITDACWHAVYVKAGLPALQENDDMVEREIIEFLTGETCEVCNVSKIHVEYICELRLRVCYKCEHEEDTFIKDLGTTLRDIVPPLHPLAVECIPCSREPRYKKHNNRAMYYAPDLLHVSAELHALQKEDDKKKKKRAAKMKTSELSKPSAGKKKGKKAAYKPGPLVKAYLEDGRGIAKAYRETTVALSEFVWQSINGKSNAGWYDYWAISKIRDANWAFVKAKAKELDIDYPLMYFSVMREDQLVQAPVPFTESDWEKYGHRFITAFQAARAKQDRYDLDTLFKPSDATVEAAERERTRYRSLLSSYKAMVLSCRVADFAPGYIPFVDWASLPTIRALVTDDRRTTLRRSSLERRQDAIKADEQLWREKASFLHKAWRLYVVHGVAMPAEWKPTEHRGNGEGVLWAPISPTNAFVLPDAHKTIFPVDTYGETNFFNHPVFSPIFSKLYMSTSSAESSLRYREPDSAVWLPSSALSQHRVGFIRQVLEAAGVEVTADGPASRAKINAIGKKFLVYREVKSLPWSRESPEQGTPYWDVDLPLKNWKEAVRVLSIPAALLRRS